MTLIRTGLQADAPIELPANYSMNGADRRYIDEQIRGIMLHLTESVIRGVLGTHYELDGASAAVAVGDWVCAAGTGLGTTGLVKVTRVTAGALSSAGVPRGLALAAAAPGGIFRVATGGIIPPSLTGLSASSGPVRVNTSTARSERVSSIGGGDYAAGHADAAGYLSLSPAAGSGVSTAKLNLLASELTDETVDFTLARQITLTLDQDITELTVVPPSVEAENGVHVTFQVKQDVVGNRTIGAYSANVKFVADTAPTLSSSAGYVDVWAAYVDGDDDVMRFVPTPGFTG
jgi:hypothetical protein